MLVEGVWQEVLGRKVGVRCTVAGEATVAATPASSPAGVAPPAGGATSAPIAVSDDDVLLGDARKLGAIVRPLTSNH